MTPPPLRHDPARLGRRGFLSSELLLVMPIFLALLFAMLRFSLELSARQSLATACQVGARVAAQGGDAAEIELAVRRSLGDGSLGQAVVNAEVEAADGSTLPSGEPVAVTVEVPTARVVPDLLRFVGLGIGDRTMSSRVVMRKE